MTVGEVIDSVVSHLALVDVGKRKRLEQSFQYFLCLDIEIRSPVRGSSSVHCQVTSAE